MKDYRLGTGQLWAWLGRGKFPPDQMCSRDEKVTGHQQKKFPTSFRQAPAAVVVLAGVGWMGQVTVHNAIIP